MKKNSAVYCLSFNNIPWQRNSFHPFLFYQRGSVYSSDPSASVGLQTCISLLSFKNLTVKKILLGGAWVAHSVKRLTLGFSSGQDLRVYGIELPVKLCAVCLGFSLSLSLPLSPCPSAPPPLMHAHSCALSKCINKR